MQSLSAQLKTYRLSQSEYDQICQLLGRPPKGVEWALFSALWSEHCSYKSSRVHLKKLFNRSSRVLQSMGENAGIVDLGEGEKIAFKMESHNHPSFIEPYQGAATGVGGILRDIFTMGARPVALANYLCFGEPKAPRMEALVDGVVRGIGGYGNCVGVPTITGQTEFDSSYNNNILVNALALGLFRAGDPVCLSGAKGPGNWVVYVGAKTGRDGVHGASMASESFGEDSAAKRPTVQIGDPFFEKLLIESCLDVMKQDLVVAIQDMGAAGLTSSSFEMASKGGVGMNLYLDKVPLRDSTMLPEEILLSESQERMLLVCEPAKFEAIQKVFHRWDLDAVCVGEIIAEKQVRLHWHGEVLTDLDPDLLVENAPLYRRPYDEWKTRLKGEALPTPTQLGEPAAAGLRENLMDCLRSEKGSSRAWIYGQYDQRVGAATVRDCGHSVGVIQLPDSKRLLGLVLGGRPHVMRWDAQVGGADSIFYPALELAAKGFRALAATDCLNYGNPERVEVMTEFVASLESLNEVCRLAEIPIISGNVSFYNETQGKNITSTPATGVVGLRNEPARGRLINENTLGGIPEDRFHGVGREVWLLRLPMIHSSGYYGAMKHGQTEGSGKLAWPVMTSFLRLVESLACRSEVWSTRVVGKFGLAYALARQASGGVGIRVSRDGLRRYKYGLFDEVFYEILWELSPGGGRELSQEIERNSSRWTGVGPSLGWLELGRTVKGALEFEGEAISLSWDDLISNYETGWGRTFEGLA